LAHNSQIAVNKAKSGPKMPVTVYVGSGFTPVPARPAILTISGAMIIGGTIVWGYGDLFDEWFAWAKGLVC